MVGLDRRFWMLLLGPIQINSKVACQMWPCIHCQHYCLGHQHPRYHWMSAPRQLKPRESIWRAKGSNRAKFCLELIPWAPIASEAPSDITSDAGVLYRQSCWQWDTVVVRKWEYGPGPTPKVDCRPPTLESWIQSRKTESRPESLIMIEPDNHRVVETEKTNKAGWDVGEFDF